MSLPGGSDGDQQFSSRQQQQPTITSPDLYPVMMQSGISSGEGGAASAAAARGHATTTSAISYTQRAASPIPMLSSLASMNDDTNSSDDSGTALQTSKNTPIFLRFAQVKGSLDELPEIVNEADMITAVEFDETGHFLATGDKGGRIVVFERVKDVAAMSNNNNTNNIPGENTSANSRRNQIRQRNSITSGSSAAATMLNADEDDEMIIDSENTVMGMPLNVSNKPPTTSSTVDGREVTHLSMHRTSSASLTSTSLADYNVYTTFQSHQPEFDYLKSVEIEEKINQIKWLKQRSPARFLLSTNDKTVKLWKLVERHKIAVGFNFGDDVDLNELYEDIFIDKGNVVNTSSAISSMLSGSGAAADTTSTRSSIESGVTGSPSIASLRRRRLSRVRIPQFTHRPHGQISVEPIETRVYANAHTYHINSISVCSDQETFMSIDDLRINLWHVDSNRESWTIVDMKPENMENLTEVITSGTFHPSQCHVFAYSSSKGLIRLCDMRQNALCDSNYKLFYEKFEAEGGSTQSATQAASNRSFFAEIIASIADVKFSHGGNLMCSRDYLWCKVWDLRYETRPLESYAVHEYVRPKLCSLYENDCIFDKFEVCFSHDDRHLLTGSYNNFFRIFDRNTKHDFIYEASRACVELQPQQSAHAAAVAAAQQQQQQQQPPYRKMSPAPPQTAQPANGDRAVTSSNSDVLLSQQQQERQQQQQFQVASAYPSILKPKRVTLGSGRNVSGGSSNTASGGILSGLGRQQSGGSGTSGGSNTSTTGNNNNSSSTSSLPYPLNEVDSVPIDELDFVHQKILHPTWHPHENLLAIATTNNLFLFTGHSTSALAGGDYYPSTSASNVGSSSDNKLSSSGAGSAAGIVSYAGGSSGGGRSGNVVESIGVGSSAPFPSRTLSSSPPRSNLRMGGRA